MLAGAALYDRSGWPACLAGEATYLMQAKSLAEDFDLAYTRADYDRWVLSSGGDATDLSLISANGGRQITFDRPFPYALYLAPFLALSPAHGFALANALLLIAVCLLAARGLEKRVGIWGPLSVAILVFASVLFAYVFLATGDLFLFAVTLLAFCLLAGAAQGPTGDGGRRPASGGRTRRWMAAGALLAIPVATESHYLVLPVMACLVATGGARGAARAALGVGFSVALVLQIVVAWWVGGGLEILGASQFKFTPETGFPLVDFSAAEWPRQVRQLSALHWDGAPRFSWGLDPRLWAWDVIYLLVGRSIGILPYFAPLLLLGAGALAGLRRPFLIASVVWGLAVVIWHPFNIFGGEGAIANRLFLPVYGALWMLIGPPRRQTAVFALASVVLAAPFLWPLWASPWSYPIAPQEGYRHVTKVARALLPYEASQRRLPGGDVAEHNGLTIRFLTHRGWAETHRNRLVIDGKGPAELLVASLTPLDTLRLDFGKEAPGQIEIRGAALRERLLQPSGGISFRVEPRSWLRHHPMWWSPEPHWQYRLTVELPEVPDRNLGFQLYGERFEANVSKKPESAPASEEI